jgi:hypothetical protein
VTAAAIKYAADHKEIVRADYEKAAGVGKYQHNGFYLIHVKWSNHLLGVVVSEQDIKNNIAAYIAENKKSIEEDRYRSLGPTLSKLKKLDALRWANAGLIKTELEAQFEALLGPKDERDAPVPKKKVSSI